MKYIITILLISFMSINFIEAQPPCLPVSDFETFKIPPPNTSDPDGNDEDPPEGERIVYWLHGLGGVPEFWSPPATHYETIRLINSKKPAFADAGIPNAVADLEDELSTLGDSYSAENGIDRSKNFIVGQSMGNLVARGLDRYYAEVLGEDERRFGGLISFAGPHQGARILNNADLNGPAMISEFAEEGAIALTKGPVTKVLEDIEDQLSSAISTKAKIFSFLLGPEIGVTLNLVDSALDDIDLSSFLLQPLQALIASALDLAIPILFADFVPADDGMTNNAKDHMVGAPFLEELNQFESNIPMVSIYSLEEDPIFWRVISSFDAQQPHLFPAFQAVDNEWVGKASELIMDYKADKDNPDFNSDVRFAYHQGFDWLVKANGQWKIIIGLNYLNYDYECHCEQYDENGNFLYTFPAYHNYQDFNPFDDESPTNCSDYPMPANAICYDASGPSIQLLELDEGSDGVVVKSSAEDLSGRITEFEALGANHQEIRNHAETKRILDGLMIDGEIEGDEVKFFRTKKRN